MSAQKERSVYGKSYKVNCIRKRIENELIDKNDGHNVELSYVTEAAIIRGIDKVCLNDHLDD